jgi:hypothetical protein
MPPDARELSRMLAARIAALAPELLPHGKRDGQEWRCGSLAGEAGQSLAVHLSGARAGVWSDFASGEAGDALDLVAAIRFNRDRRAAMAWARTWLALPSGGRQDGAPEPPRAAPVSTPAAISDDAEKRRRAAQALFLSARPSLAGTPAGFYLAARGIDLAELQRQPRSLRFHPSLWSSEAGRNFPGMLGAITNAAGQHTATHRTWLARDAGGVWRKAPLRHPKKSLGGIVGGTIRIWRGASGKALAEAPEGETVVIAEGIETALSIAVACPALRVLSAVSLGNMARVALPPAIRSVIIAADNDPADNQAAARGLAAAIAHFAEGGRLVRVARSPVGKDFNDALAAETGA